MEEEKKEASVVDEGKSNRRGITRLSNRMRLQFDMNVGDGSGFVVNQSENGLFLNSHKLLRVGSPICLRDSSGLVLLRGRVAWNKQSLSSTGARRSGMGIHIIEAHQIYSDMMLKLREERDSTFTKAKHLKTQVSEIQMAKESLEPLLQVEGSSWVPSQGQLSDYLLPQILMQLHLRNFTGYLFLGQQADEIIVHYGNGRIVFIASPLFNRLFLQKLFSLQLIDKQQQEMLLGKGKLDKVLQSLMSQIRIQVNVLFGLLQQQQTEMVVSFFGQTQGGYRFIENSRAANVSLPMPLDVPKLVRQGIEQSFSRKELKDRFILYDSDVIRKLRRPGAGELVPTQHAKMLKEIGFPIRVKTLREKWSYDLDEIRQPLFLFLIMGWISLDQSVKP